MYINMKEIKSLLLVASIAAFVMYHIGITTKLRDEKARLEQNQAALMLECDTLRMENGRHVATTDQLTLKRDEFAELCSELSARCNELGIKNKRLNAIVNTHTTTEARVDTIVRDSIVYVPQANKYDTIQYFQWQDPWIRMQGSINDGRLSANIKSKDTLLVVAHRIPKRFLFFKFGTKKVRLTISSSNPHTSITHAEYITLQK